MANEDEVEATSAELASLGGTVESYTVPEETMEAVDSTEEVQPADESATDDVADTATDATAKEEEK